jgi:hypothetical protein
MARDKILLEYNGGKAEGLQLNFTVKELKKAKDFKFTSKLRRNKIKKSICICFFFVLCVLFCPIKRNFYKNKNKKT